MSTSAGRPRPPRLVGVLAILGLAVAPLAAQDTPIAFTNAHVIPVAGPEIPSGTVVIADGVITAVGPRADVPVPADAQVVDLDGKVLTPGLVCTHSHIAEPWGADDSDPIQPGVRNLDALNVRAASVHRARAGGITAANCMPGSGHLISGQTTYLKLRRGDVVDDLLIRDDDGRIMGGLKMANGTNSQGEPPFPGTRAKSAALVRQAYLDAQAYAEKLAGDDAPGVDLDLATLAEVLAGERVVHHHTHRHDDIVTVLRLRAEFGFRLVLQHVTAAYRVVDEIAAAGVPCSLILIDTPGGKIEAMDMSWETGAVLEAAGVPVAFHTDDPINDSRLFIRSAALAVRGGMSRAGALASVTLTGAQMLDLDDRVGSLEPGKDADLVIWSGDPLSVYSLVEQTWVEGQLVFDLSDPDDAHYAHGGEGASHGTTAHVHGLHGEGW